ncbi:MAG: hypothetical protein PHP18_05620 [Bacilli bacterium]|nr:hypothetical protein [Bacilli bacterium]
MKFRKKPVIIEAELYKPGMEDSIDKLTNKPYIKTLEGNHIITDGDWIITGVKGERYPCKPDIFEITYEKVD